MKKLMLIMLALVALMISGPVAMARDANWNALDKAWKDQVKQERQENQRMRMAPLKTGSEWDITVPDWGKPSTSPGLQRPGRR